MCFRNNNKTNVFFRLRGELSLINLPVTSQFHWNNATEAVRQNGFNITVQSLSKRAHIKLVKSVILIVSSVSLVAASIDCGFKWASSGIDSVLWPGMQRNEEKKWGKEGENIKEMIFPVVRSIPFMAVTVY